MSSAFDLRVPDDGLATLTFDLPDRPVNVFSRAVMAELTAVIEAVAGRDDVRCLVLLSGKPRNFIAGADIEEISQVSSADEATEAAERGQAVFNAWEALPFPTVAAVRGSCVGGGCEIALASDFIVLSDREDVRIGLPEVRLGIVPGWGGCTRLPRKVGLTAALDVILAGKTLRPGKALKIGLADALVPDASFSHEVRRFAAGAAEGGKRRSRKGGLKSVVLEGNPLGRMVVFDQARKQILAKTGGHYPAPLRAIEVIKAGIQGGAAKGFRAEARAIGELAVSPVTGNLVRLFQLVESTKAAARESPRQVEQVGVLGAGVMGGGIAQIVSDKADLPVRMKDIGAEQLASGMAHASSLFYKQVKRRWIRKSDADRKMALIRPTLSYRGFESADLIVEAVVEKLEVKRKVFAEVEAAVRPDTILASNTSSISIDLIAAEARHPERFVGMHFFNPVHKMPLVEIIRGSATQDEVVETVAAFCHTLGKTPVVVKDGPGFLVNRLLGFTLAEAMWLLDEGVPIDELDRAASRWGLPMGPVTLTDEVGIDVAVKVARILADAFPERLSFPAWFEKVPEDGRLGTKAGKGFYLYEDGKRGKVDPDVLELIGSSGRRREADRGRLVDRLLLPMLNEAARCLEEKVVASPDLLDLAMIMGTGFPPFHGGPCRWADAQGPASLLAEMERIAERVGDRFAPSAAFRETVEAGGFAARSA
ncbi:MAG: 3-hydroxyacyl-CoA dehydrogenase NAD-binding domain-containing protein [Thermoanaerobaculia bacterium]|nr:3-hydroxyacyl-CoA dehydrogenase NAD-binding domain-containing protein [Thermoanaerobaculia bacterium]